MKQILISVPAALLFGACALTAPLEDGPASGGETTAEGQLRPMERPSEMNADVETVSATARTVEEFDTTTAEQRSAATAQGSGASGERDLGRTVASLGSPTRPGFWLKTPLVSAPAKGRVTYPATGKSVVVDLIPINGPKTAGSQLSLPAMRLLEAPLAGLPEVEVHQINS